MRPEMPEFCNFLLNWCIQNENHHPIFLQMEKQRWSEKLGDRHRYAAGEKTKINTTENSAEAISLPNPSSYLANDKLALVTERLAVGDEKTTIYSFD